MDLNMTKSEKSRAKRRFNRLRRIAKVFRFVELCVLLALLSCWISTRLPGDFIRWLAGVVVSPLFVFALGNLIIVTLMAKSGKFSVRDRNAAESDSLFESLRSAGQDESVPAPEPVYEDKEVICVQKLQDSANVAKVEPDSKLSRSQSENVKRDTVEMFPAGKTLRRSETDVVCRRKAYREEEEENVFPEDGMSSEEFRRTIEAFIAKQQKFRREESRSIVLLQGQA